MPTQTTVFNLNKPTVAGDADTWGGSTGLNGTIDKIESAMKATATTGSSNAYVLSSGLSLTAYATGQVLRIIPNFTNSGAATINVDGLGTKAITKTGATALASGDLTSGRVYTLSYDGTQFQVVEINALEATLATIAALTPTTDQMIYFTGTDTAATTGINSSARTALASMTAAGSAMATAASAAAQAALLAGLVGDLDVQTFSGNGTWTKPANAQLVLIDIVGGGGGGGGGGATTGGGGGGGGYRAQAFIAASVLGATESVTIANGGTAGVASGANGGAGGTSNFGTWLYAYGGGGGPTNSTSGGGGSGGSQSAGSGITGGSGGGLNSSASAAVQPFSPTAGSPGGTAGGGGGGAARDAILGPGGGGGGASSGTGGAGGRTIGIYTAPTGGTGANAGTAGAASPLDPNVGSGGGGGGPSSGTGGAGARGSGGGGGGANGNGGAGGAGYATIYTWVFA